MTSPTPISIAMISRVSNQNSGTTESMEPLTAIMYAIMAPKATRTEAGICLTENRGSISRNADARIKTSIHVHKTLSIHSNIEKNLNWPSETSG